MSWPVGEVEMSEATEREDATSKSRGWCLPCPNDQRIQGLTFTCFKCRNPFSSECPSHIKQWPLHHYRLPAYAQEPGQEARNGNRAASYGMCLAHQPSTAASMLVKGRHRSAKGVDHQRRLNTAEAAGMLHQDVATTNTELPHLFNASQMLTRTREMQPNLQAEAKAVEDARVA